MTDQNNLVEKSIAHMAGWPLANVNFLISLPSFRQVQVQGRLLQEWSISQLGVNLAGRWEPTQEGQSFCLGWIPGPREWGRGLKWGSRIHAAKNGSVLPVLWRKTSSFRYHLKRDMKLRVCVIYYWRYSFNYKEATMISRAVYSKIVSLKEWSCDLKKRKCVSS